VYTLYGCVVVIHQHHYHHVPQQQTMSHSRLVPSSCEMVSPGQTMFLLLVGMYSYANFGMYHSILTSVVSTCIYNPPQFRLNCMYLVPFLFCLMVLFNIHHATDLRTFISAVSFLFSSSFIKCQFSSIYELAQPLPYINSTILLYYLF
jgi:hypothetical protein